MPNVYETQAGERRPAWRTVDLDAAASMTPVTALASNAWRSASVRGQIRQGGLRIRAQLLAEARVDLRQAAHRVDPKALMIAVDLVAFEDRRDLIVGLDRAVRLRVDPHLGARSGPTSS